jgi:hypothetical protein
MRRLVVILVFSLLSLFLWQTGVSQGFFRTVNFPPVVNYWLKSVGLDLKPTPVVVYPVLHTTPDQITQKINQYRLSHNLKAFDENPGVCGTITSANLDTLNKQITPVCPTCNHVAVITTPQLVSPNELLTALIDQDSTNNYLLEAQKALLCVVTDDTSLYLVFLRQSSKPSKVSVTPEVLKEPTANPTPVSKNFTEDELWVALTEYRRANGRTTISKDEAMCVYARTRVQDQIKLMAEKPQTAYPNPDKYPLDAHQGFMADADSGLAFDVTHRTHLAENLAYWPNAPYPNRVIEWGWDSSTEGHRETQLSNDWSQGCIANDAGFYVAIFGN